MPCIKRLSLISLSFICSLPAFTNAETIKIGATVSDTGSLAILGQEVRRGYDTWLQWVNDERGGIQVGSEKHLVEIIYYNDESNPAKGAELVEKLITEDGVDFMLGPYASSMTFTTSAVSEQHNIIMVQGNGADEGLYSRGFQNMFGVLTPASNYTESALRMLADSGARTVVIGHEDDSFSTSVANGALHWAETYGIEVLAMLSYPENPSDVSSVLTQARNLNPDIYVGAGHYNGSILLAQTAKQLAFNPHAMVFTVGPSTPAFITTLGTDAEGIIGPTQWEPVMAYEDEWFGTAQDYADLYQDLWDLPTTYQAAESTAAALVLMLAIEAAASLQTADVRQALNELDIVTFYGPVNFDSTGKNTGKPMGSIQIQDSEILVIAPADAAQSPLLYPKRPFGATQQFWGYWIQNEHYIDTAHWMGWLYTGHAPWIYSYSAASWFYAFNPGDSPIQNGTWFFSPR